ncbi:MAG: T9SS type B sorting domain-containing protein [Bacteroidia bacterium]
MRNVLLHIFILLCLFTRAQKLNLLPDTVGICRGDSTFLEVRSSAFSKNATYEWRTPVLIIQRSNTLEVKQQGKYYIKVNSGNMVYTDSCYVKYYSRPRLMFGDTIICNSSSAVIQARNSDYKYTWSNDETASRFRIENAGKYWVKINNKGCSVIDTFNVSFFQSSTVSFGNEATFCLSDENRVLSIKPAPGTKVTWSTGASGYSITPGKGWHWVKTESKTCGTRIDSVNVKLKACDCEILVPNSFTPNEDDRNDYFFPVLQCEYTYYSLTIFDRWNNIVFITNSPNGKWDGRYKGNLCPDDLYVWRIETVEKGSDKKSARTGQISLFR